MDKKERKDKMCASIFSLFFMCNLDAFYFVTSVWIETTM